MANFKIGLCDENFKESDAGDLALFIDGEVFTTYSRTYVPETARIFERMLDVAFQQGKEANKNEIKKLLGV